MKPWKPGMGDVLAGMSKEEKARLLEKLKPMMDALNEHEKQHY